MSTPRVLVTLAGDGADDLAHQVKERHVRMLVGAGLLPLFVTGSMPAGQLDELLAECSAVYLPGTDYVPERLDEDEAVSARSAEATGIPWDPWKVRADLRAVDGAWRARLPTLGVCGGMQAMVIHAGGALRRGTEPEIAAHRRVVDGEAVQARPGTLAAEVWPEGATANSYHSQVVDRVPAALVTSIVAADGVVEAVEAPRPAHPFWLGVQWHPEQLGDERPFAALARAAAAAR
jgi:gamma-glutamyl-gamma-aminobutyrate hydrolase PuuD